MGRLRTSAVDKLLDATRQREIPLVVQLATVPCMEPTAGEGHLVSVRVILVTLGDVGALDANLANLPRRHLGT